MNLRSHIVFSQEPLCEGQPVTALCGAEVPNSVFTFRSIGGKPDETWGNTFLFCHKCTAKLILSFPHQTYVYGARPKRPGDDNAVEAA